MLKQNVFKESFKSGHRANEDVHLIVRKSPVLDFCLSNSARKEISTLSRKHHCISEVSVQFLSSRQYFNSLQSECFSACFQSDVNMVISAPTGSGKTIFFELCILRLLSRFISTEGRFIYLKRMLKTVGFQQFCI
ncbi:DExH-box ATP-dependent RNA helicase DExH17-like [Camellia sinensis]|uniref:DExH-box ATP-dependent RNA helicase DExH17-like n=1 Tax=Camellia sinensis TaxID=4442 RepID=UPI0010363BC7|nr:DExH-box ATP-dependent RNA helicase DExH17-like [Camellia sinensis]